MKLVRLLLRAAVGGLFIGHGTQKLFGWFGGQGLTEASAGFEAMGIKPGKLNATAAGTTEALGGAGLALGYRVPLASAGLVSVMLTAINRVHLKNGPWAHQNGYEYNLVLILAALSIVEAGPGPLSVDALRGKEKSGTKWALFSLLLGAAGAAGAHALAESQKSHEEAGSEAAAAAAASVNGSDPVPAPADQAAPAEQASAADQAPEAEEASEAEPAPAAEEASAAEEGSESEHAPEAEEAPAAAEQTSSDAPSAEA